MARSLPIKRSAGLLFVSGRKVLLLRRAKGCNNAGLWGIPGGRRDPGETVADAAWREASEELHRVPTAEIVGRLQLRRDRGRKRYDIFVCQTGKRARARFKPRLNHEHDRYQWVSMDWCLAHLDSLHPVIAELLRDPRVSAALDSQLHGRSGFTRREHHASGTSRIALRPAA